jgi:hypothetical protein
VALSTDDVNAVMAEWEKWTADAGFRLSIEVKSDELDEQIVMGDPPGSIGARVVSRLYCQVQVWRDDALVFDERVPHDAAVLRASVTVLVRAIAEIRG